MTEHEYERLIQRAIQDGRIPTGRANRYRRLLDADPVRGGAIIAALQAVPTRRRDVTASAAALVDEPACPKHWIPALPLGSGSITFEDAAVRSPNGDAPSYGPNGTASRGGYGPAGRQADYGLIGREC